MKNIVRTGALALCFLSGVAMTLIFNVAVAEDGKKQPPAYLIISVNEIHPEKLGPYKKAAGQLTKKYGGAKLLGLSTAENIEILEGNWEFPGLLLVEKFESMEALKQYWYSDEYQDVKKLREGYAEANFFVAIEGRPE